MDLTGLLVERVVVHRIPQKEPKALAAQQEPLWLAEAASPLPDTLRAYMNMRLLGSLQSADKAFDVIFDDAAVTTAPAEVRSYLATEALALGTDEERDDALVALSRSLATRLFDAQPTQPLAGLFAVSSGTIAGRPFLAAMKLEHEKGVTVDEVRIDGRQTLAMTVEDGLVLVQGTKVFKAAAFAPNPIADLTALSGDFDCEGRLSDTQNPFTASGVANYFAHDTLGVRLVGEPRVITEQVFKAVEDFLDETVTEPAARVTAESALIVEMSSNRQTFSAQSFGNNHLTPELRRGLRDVLNERSLPLTAFPKDLNLIENRLKMIALEFEGRISVVGPQNRFDDDTIQIDGSQANGEAVVKIRSPLKRTNSRGR